MLYHYSYTLYDYVQLTAKRAFFGGGEGDLNYGPLEGNALPPPME